MYVYVCVCACIYVCTHICMCVRAYMCICVCIYVHMYVYILFFFGHACSMWKFPGQGWNPRHSSDSSHWRDSAASLTHRTTREHLYILDPTVNIAKTLGQFRTSLAAFAHRVPLHSLRREGLQENHNTDSTLPISRVLLKAREFPTHVQIIAKQPPQLHLIAKYWHVWSQRQYKAAGDSYFQDP